MNHVHLVSIQNENRRGAILTVRRHDTLALIADQLIRVTRQGVTRAGDLGSGSILVEVNQGLDGNAIPIVKHRRVFQGHHLAQHESRDLGAIIASLLLLSRQGQWKQQGQEGKPAHHLVWFLDEDRKRYPPMLRPGNVDKPQVPKPMETNPFVDV